jgi:uncharacterized protein YegP (UPF0339 family)
MADEKLPCYRERKDNGGYWYWIYYGKNGEELARSSESYVNRSDCLHCINLIKESKGDPVYYYD